MLCKFYATYVACLQKFASVASLSTFLTIQYCNIASRCRVDVKGLGCSDVSQ